MIPLNQIMTNILKEETKSMSTSQNLTESEALSLERFKLSRTSESIKSVSIALVIDEMIKGMNKLGLKADKLPNKEEMVMIYKSMIEEYPNLKIGELSLAFDLAAKGKLDIEAETYQNFSMLYLHRILRSFARYGLNQLSNIKRVEPNSNWMPREVTDEEKIELAFESYKKFKQWDAIVFGLDVFKILYKRKELRFNSNEILELTKQEMTKKMMSLPYIDKLEMRGKIQDDNYMENQCRRMALSIYFDKLLNNIL